MSLNEKCALRRTTSLSAKRCDPEARAAGNLFQGKRIYTSHTTGLIIEAAGQVRTAMGDPGDNREKSYCVFGSIPTVASILLQYPSLLPLHHLHSHQMASSNGCGHQIRDSAFSVPQIDWGVWLVLPALDWAHTFACNCRSVGTASWFAFISLHGCELAWLHSYYIADR